MTKKLPMADYLDPTTLRALAALADHTRPQILFLLGKRGRLCVGDIAANFHLSRPAISHHLKVLKDAGVLQSEKAGQEVYYWADCGNLVTMLRDLADRLESCYPSPPDPHGSLS